MFINSDCLPVKMILSMAHIQQQFANKCCFPFFTITQILTDSSGRFILFQYPNIFFYAKVDVLLLSNIKD